MVLQCARHSMRKGGQRAQQKSTQSEKRAFSDFMLLSDFIFRRTFGAGGEADGLWAQHNLAAAADRLPQPEHHGGPTVLHAHLQAAALGLALAARRAPRALQPPALGQLATIGSLYADTCSASCDTPISLDNSYYA